MPETDVASFCTQCGHRFSRASAFCPQCGSPVQTLTATDHPAVPAPGADAHPVRVPGEDATTPTTQAQASMPAAHEQAPPPAPAWGPPVPATVERPSSTPAPSHSHPAALPGGLTLRPEPAPVALDAPAATVAQRIIANLIDSALAMVPTVIVFVLVGILGAISDKAGTIIGLVLELALVAGIIAYVIVYNGRGGTIGKRMMGVRVVDLDTGAWIGPAHSAVRYLVLGLEGIPCYLGYLSPFLDKTGRLRGWHDMAASDRVVSVPTEPLNTAWQP